MGLFKNLFGGGYDGKSLVNAYKSQQKNKRYDFVTFAFLECSNNNITYDQFSKIFLTAHDILKNDQKLSQEEVWILLDLGISLKLGEIDIVDFMAKHIVFVPKLLYRYEFFSQYSQQDREVISTIASEEWALKVNILNKEQRKLQYDDFDNIFFQYPQEMQTIWLKYNKELYNNIF